MCDASLMRHSGCMPEELTAAATANAFLDIQEGDKGTFPRIDPMKMQKLLFYAAAWWLALKEKPLFPEEICAWPWGPVVPNVYTAFRDFGRNPIIGRRATEIVRVGPGHLDFERREPKVELSSDGGSFLRGVWNSHKLLTGIQLSNATHAPGEPWTIVKEQYRDDLSSKPIIPNDLIKEVFKRKLPVNG